MLGQTMVTPIIQRFSEEQTAHVISNGLHRASPMDSQPLNLAHDHNKSMMRYDSNSKGMDHKKENGSKERKIRK